MQRNVSQNDPLDMGPFESKRQLINFLAIQRRSVRLALRNVNAMVDCNMAEARLVKKYRASGNPFLIRNSETIEARIAARRKDIASWNDMVLNIGHRLWAFADYIDHLIPISELFDILEVNPVDRTKVCATEGFKEIVFVRGLEDSATHRESDWKEGPLFEAMVRWMMHCMDTSPDLKNRITDGMFGKGGLFEFVPTYSRTTSGEFKRNPPKLRLADETDLRPGI